VRVVGERCAPEADFRAVMAHERRISPQLGGRTVKSAGTRQLSLF
jgi:hypothetical protein